MHAWASALEGWSLVEADPATGVSLMERALCTMRSAGAAQFVTHFIALLAGAQQRRLQIEECRRTIDQGLELVEQTGERFYLAELMRLKGELLAASGAKARDESQRVLLDAIRVARTQGAKLLELRAAASLVRLAGHERPGEARQTLATVLDGITEGRDLPDVKSANDLLRRVDARPRDVDALPGTRPRRSRPTRN